jgi:hypothetical protein
MSANDLYDRKWKSDVEEFIAGNSRSAPVVAYLHPPKTGGSSLIAAIDHSSLWNLVSLNASYKESAPIHRNLFLEGAFVSGGDEPVDTRPVGTFFKFSHEKFDAVRWLWNAFDDAGVRLDCTCMSVRPIRQRLVSMFKDYWTQVYRFESGLLDDPGIPEWKKEIIYGYVADSRYYRDRNGNIAGRKWFEAFAEYGGGVPFFLDEIFEGDVDRFADCAASGKLKLLPSATIDDFIRDITEFRHLARARVSITNNIMNTDDEIEKSSDLIDALCQRDREFERQWTARKGPGPRAHSGKVGTTFPPGMRDKTTR